MGRGNLRLLVEQERPNVFTTSVANIPPGAAIAIEIEYQQAVRYDAGQFALRFPMVVGPRYIPGTVDVGHAGTGWAADTDTVPDASRITPPMRDPFHGAINPVTLRVELDPGVPLAGVASPSHAIHTRPLSGGRYEIELEEGSVAADRDFRLEWIPVTGAAPAAVVLAEPRGDEVFALLMVMPPATRVVEGDRLPREIVFVLDRSGSMGGASIEQVQAALKLVLARLRPAFAPTAAPRCCRARFPTSTWASRSSSRPGAPDGRARRATARHRRAMRALPQDGSGRGGVATWALTRSASWRWRSSRWRAGSSARAAGSTPRRSSLSTCPSTPGRGRLPASGKSAPGRGPTRGPSPRVPMHGIGLIVLDGVSGRTLAFGPGHAGGSARPGAPGTAIVSGHRDTHFRFLQRVTPGEEIVVETPGRPAVRFHVREATVVDARTAVIGSAGDGTAALVLQTCYPFDAVNPGGPLRYVVAAEAASAEARRISSE